MRDLPKDWQELPLISLLDALESGSRPKGGVKGISQGISSVGGEHLSYSGGFDFSSPRYVPKEFADQMTKGQIKSGDILVVKDGATTAKTAYVGPDFPYQKAVVNEHVFICRPKPEILGKYLFYYLFSSEGQARILDNFQGSAQGGINRTFGENTLIPVAPPRQRQQIVKELDNILSKIQAIQARLGKIPVLLKRFRQSVLSAACSGRLTADWRIKYGTKSKDWETCYLGDIANLKLGKMLDGSKNQGDFVPYLKNINVRWFSVEIENLSEMRATQQDRRTFSIKDGDILLCEGGEPGRCAVWTKGSLELIFQKAIHRIRLNGDNIHPMWLAYYIKDDAENGRLEQYFTGTTIKHLTSQSLAKYKVLLPSYEEQIQAINRIKALLKFADSVEAKSTSARDKTEKLSKAILSNAFHGKLFASSLFKKQFLSTLKEKS